MQAFSNCQLSQVQWRESCICKQRDSEKCDIIDDDDENQFAKGQRSRDLRGRSDAKGDLAQTESGRADDLKIMNQAIVINSAQMFFRNFGLRHVKAALGLAIELAAPNAGQKIIARFAGGAFHLIDHHGAAVSDEILQR